MELKIGFGFKELLFIKTKAISFGKVSFFTILD